MKTRTLVTLAVVLALVAVSAWVVLADGGNTFMDWFAAMHGRPRGH